MKIKRIGNVLEGTDVETHGDDLFRENREQWLRAYGADKRRLEKRESSASANQIPAVVFDGSRPLVMGVDPVRGSDMGSIVVRQGSVVLEFIDSDDPRYDGLMRNFERDPQKSR